MHHVREVYEVVIKIASVGRPTWRRLAASQRVIVGGQPISQIILAVAGLLKWQVLI